MNMTKSEKMHFLSLLKKYACHEKAKQMKQYIQHGKITTYSHCFSVALTSYYVNRKLRLGVDEKSLVKAAFLHDFYLYDWHEASNEHRLHGFSHAKKAAENADRYFGLNRQEYQAIKSHMWPLTLTSMPKDRMGWIVCLSDKYCAAWETLFGR